MVFGSNESFDCSTAELGLRKVKLGIEGTGDENSGWLDSWQLPKEKPSGTEQGVPLSTRKEENDDLHVNAGEFLVSPSIDAGEPSLKLKS